MPDDQKDTIAKTLSQVQIVYSNTQDQIKFADAKTSFIVGLTSLLVGFVFSHIKEISTHTSDCIFSGVLILFGLSVVMTLCLPFMVFFPSHGGNTIQTRVFFKHIKNNFEYDFKKYYEEVSILKTEDWLLEYSAQVVEISQIACYKQSKFKLACATGACTVFLTVAMATYLFIK